MSTPEDLRADAIEEMELDDLYNEHEAGAHDGDMRKSDCPRCEQELDDAAAEFAWMGQAVKTWTGPNPYAPSDPQAPDRSWYIDANGWVKSDA